METGLLPLSAEGFFGQIKLICSKLPSCYVNCVCRMQEISGKQEVHFIHLRKLGPERCLHFTLFSPLKGNFKQMRYLLMINFS